MDANSQNVLIIIATAVTIQTLLMVGMVVAGVVVWKRTSEMLESRLRLFNGRMDDVVKDARAAVEAVEHLSGQASEVLHEAGGVVRTVATVVGGPRALLIAGASAASDALFRWRRRRNSSSTR